MAGRVHGKAPHAAHRLAFAILEQPVDLAAVALKLGALVEHVSKHVLYDQDILTNPDLAAETLLYIGGRTQVVGMGIGDTARRIVDIHNRIDDGAGS
jgi:hypothetical protein